MDRANLRELHYITHMENVPLIAARGLLSHRRAAVHQPTSVAMEDVQDRRSGVSIPSGRALHDYVNLYICGRNPMLFYCSLGEGHRELCVLSVSEAVLDLPDVVVTDQNAARGMARFAPAPGGLAIVNEAFTFAEWWIDRNEIVAYEKKGAKCAEVLVPDRVAPNMIAGAYVSCDESKQAFDGMGTGIPCSVDTHLFFR